MLASHLGHLDPTIRGLELNGANLVIAQELANFIGCEDIDVEMYFPPGVMADQKTLTKAAQEFVPLKRRGQGALTIYPAHAIPEVWADGKPRIFWCTDPEWLPSNRYLRDRYAQGPMPLFSDSHAGGAMSIQLGLARYAGCEPVLYDVIQAPSTTHAEMFRRSFEYLAGRSPCRIVVGGHGIDPEEFVPLTKEEQRFSRRLMGLPEDARIALFMGRLSYHAKADLLPLIDAFAMIAEPGDILVIAGVENVAGYGQMLQDYAASLGIAEQVRIQGQVDLAMRPIYYGAADFFVFPGDTVQEALGQTILEAFACGLPCVTSDWDGFRDLVRDGETGYRVPAHIFPAWQRTSDLSPAVSYIDSHMLIAQTVWIDPKALAEKMAVLLHNPEHCEELGRKAREFVAQSYTWECALKMNLKVWDECIEEACREAPQAREDRRSKAETLGQPVPFMHVLSHYGTSVLDPEETMVSITALGERVLNRSATLKFYDDLLPLLRPELLDAILAASNPEGTLLSVVVAQAARAMPVTVDEITFHAALLAKRGALYVKTLT